MPVQNRVVERVEVSDVLASAAYVIPPVPTGGPAVGIRWLRRSVARFSDGAEHDRRRRQVTDLLHAVAPAELRRLAAERTRTALDDAGGRPLDLMARVARVVPIEVLIATLAMPPVPVETVAVIATAYQPTGGAEEPADEAVSQLVEAWGGVPDETTSARIALLVQAYDATAGLVGNAALAMLRADDDRPVDAIVAETSLHDPPVRMTRRSASDTGTIVELDLAASGFPFGSGPHRCPGRDHATAIATGILESVRGCRLLSQRIDYHQSAALRVPVELVVAR
jgi:cytochrome P450